MRIFAAASAGPSNGAIGPLLSNAQPITIGFFALGELFAASALPIRASARTAAAAIANLPRPLMYMPPLGFLSLELDGTGRYLVNLGPVSGLPCPLEGFPRGCRKLACGNLPEGIRPRVPKAAVVREDLDVVVALPPGSVERTEKRRQVGGAVAGKDAVCPTPGRLAPVRHVDPDEAIDVLRDLVEDIWRVPQVPRVELDPQRRMIGLVEQLHGLTDRGDHRPVLAPDPVHGLEADPHPGALRLVRDRPQAGHHRVPVVAGTCEADDAAGPKRRETAHGGADRIDSLVRIGRPFHQRQGENRGDDRHGRRPTQPRGVESLQRCPVVVELQLPDADRVRAGSAVGAHVFREARRQGRDLRDRKRRPDAGILRFTNSRATSVPEPPPRPGPGHVLAPMWKRLRTGVRCPGCCAKGRQRKFWSSASEPEYGSPRSRLMFAACRSAGESTMRLRTEASRLGMCRASRCWMRSA